MLRQGKTHLPVSEATAADVLRKKQPNNKKKDKAFLFCIVAMVMAERCDAANSLQR